MREAEPAPARRALAQSLVVKNGSKTSADVGAMPTPYRQRQGDEVALKLIHLVASSR